MKPAFDVQSPCFAQAEHDTSVSSHVSEQVLQLCGQSKAKYSALLPVHSLFAAHEPHDTDLSLQ